MGVVVVGAGFLGTQRAFAARWCGRRVVGVVDPRLDVAQKLAREVGAQPFAELDEALNAPGWSAAVIASPHACHAEQIRSCFDAGKDVLCEKPLALRASAAKVLVERAERCGRVLATGFNHRFYPPVRDALELVRRGALGEVRTVRARIGHRASEAFLQGWHGNPDLAGGGTLIDNGPHAFDLILKLLGPVRVTDCLLRSRPDLPIGCEVQADVEMVSNQGARAELRSGWEQDDGYLTLDIEGTHGELRVETAPWRLIGRGVGGVTFARRYLPERVRERLFRLRSGCERSLAHELSQFFARCSGRTVFGAGGPPIADGRAGWAVTELVEEAYRASARDLSRRSA